MAKLSDLSETTDNVVQMRDMATGNASAPTRNENNSGLSTSKTPAKQPFRPLVNSGDASVKSRWFWAILVLVLAGAVGYHGIRILMTGEASVIFEIGLGRFVRAAQDVPALRPFAAIAVAAESLFFATMLCWMAVLLARDVPVPKATVGEIVIASARQLRHVRIDWAMKAVFYIALGFVLANFAEPAFQAATRVVPSINGIPAGPLLVVVAGVLEFLGMQYLVRAIAVYFIPALRSFLVVIAAPLQGGISNRICIGDGRLTRTGRQVIHHEDLISFVPQISRFRGRVLGLADLQLVFRCEGVRHAITLEAPASLKTTQLIADIVNGPWRVAKSRDRTVYQENTTSIVPPKSR